MIKRNIMKRTCMRSLVFMLCAVALLTPGCDPKEHDKYKPLECVGDNVSISDQVWSLGYGDVFNTKRATRLRINECVYGPSVKPSKKWSVSLPFTHQNNSPVVGDDGTIYLIGMHPDTSQGVKTGLIAFTPEGSIKWFFNIPLTNPYLQPWHGKVFHESISIGHDGTLYGDFFDFDSSYYAINSDGTLKWKFKPTIASERLWYGNARTTVGPDGAIFGATPDTVYCFEPSGKIRWRKPTGLSDPSPTVSNMSIGKEGIYVGFFRKGILAMDFKGKVRWFYSVDYIDFERNFAILIDSDENLYVRVDAKIQISIDRNGNKRWTGYSSSSMSQAVLSGDYLYFGSNSMLYKVHKDSNKIEKEIPIGNQMWSSSSPLIDDAGRLFVVTNNGYTVSFVNDEESWQMKGPDSGGISTVASFPVFGRNGGILFVTSGLSSGNGYHLYNIR